MQQLIWLHNSLIPQNLLSLIQTTSFWVNTFWIDCLGRIVDMEYDNLKLSIGIKNDVVIAKRVIVELKVCC